VAHHFATSNLKVDDLKLMKRQNESLRKLALAPFGESLTSLAHDPALLNWLDAPQNRQGHPNENLARELMELFTLGVGHYTEQDVKEAARALTGWTVRQDEFRDLAAIHDDGDKGILGHLGYDTHAAQIYTHASLLREFAGALKAFLNDLKAAQLDDRVIVLGFSEFGRRVEENTSFGTDHGTAGPVFLAGRKVRSSLFGHCPSLTELDHGDLKMAIDFRQVYATLLDQWLQINSVSCYTASFSNFSCLPDCRVRQAFGQQAMLLHTLSPENVLSNNVAMQFGFQSPPYQLRSHRPDEVAEVVATAARKL
jgi:hypothetical protein